MKSYSVYIIYSSYQKIHYIGHTNNLTDRLLRHNKNRNKFTKGKGPWELIVSYKCNSKVEAYKLELKLKGMKNSVKAIQYLKNLVQSIPTKSGGS
jgi:putative endonuclease